MSKKKAPVPPVALPATRAGRAPSPLPSLAADSRAAFSRLADSDREAGGKRGWVRLSETFARHLDGVSVAGALADLRACDAGKAEAFTLCVIEGKTQQEAAAALGITQSSVSRRLDAAAAHLARYFAPA